MKNIALIEDFEEFKKEYSSLYDNHIATIQELNGNNGRDCIVRFKNPNSMEGSLMFTYIDGILSISGDYGYAMFNWHNKKNHILANLGFDSFGYVSEKMVASDKVTDFDSDLFHLDFDKWKKQLIEEGHDSDFIDSIDTPYVEDESDVINFFKNFTKIDDVCEYGCYQFGMYTTWQTYARWYGFQEALKQIEERVA